MFSKSRHTLKLRDTHGIMLRIVVLPVQSADLRHGLDREDTLDSKVR